MDRPMIHEPPRLTARAPHHYHCDNIPALHRWLEAQGYQFYGYFDPHEYGRFSHQEAIEHDDTQAYVHSFIQVLHTGDLYAPDPHAIRLLNSLVTDERERTV